MKPTHILVTTGSTKGVGVEITSKAFQQIKPSKKYRYSILLPKGSDTVRLGNNWKAKQTNLKNLSNWSLISPEVIQTIKTSKNAADVFRSAANFCLQDGRSAVATAPMRKLKDGQGHTEILKDISKNENLIMAFIGKKFNVSLATTHIPISKIKSSLTKKRIHNIMLATQRLHELTGNRSDPIGVLGLNPHAGENGSISQEDGLLYKELKSIKTNSPLSQLLPPDGTFVSKPKYRTYLSWYHDQGLIPFKMAHGLSNGIQVTLGLPFIRTSVDHGTAEDIYGKNIADHRSMLMAIKFAGHMQAKYKNSIFS